MKTAAAVLMGRRREALFTYGASPLMPLSILSFLQFCNVLLFVQYTFFMMTVTVTVSMMKKVAAGRGPNSDRLNHDKGRGQ